MAIDQLSLYNNALLLLGQRKLSSLTESREPRHRLDDVYNADAIRYCLEVSEPTFARKVSNLTSSVTSSDHDLDNVFTFPSDYVSIIRLFSDANLDQPIDRYIISGDTIACNYSSVYLRYVSDGFALTAWTPSFARVVEAYLAREIAERISPNKYEEVNQKFIDRVNVVKELAKDKEPEERPSKTTVTLTNTWRYIYNDALLLIGVDEITSNTDDSARRSKLDHALDTGLVKDLLEDTSWNFGLTSMKSQYDPSQEPDFGYARVHDHPSDMQVLNGIYSDEYFRSPHKAYMDEGGKFFTDLDEIYLQYVSTDYLNTPDNWPGYFKKLVAAKLAKDTAKSILKDYQKMSATERVRAIESVDEEYKARKYDAMSRDAMLGPPRVLSQGNWTKSRYRGGYRGRPGGN